MTLVDYKPIMISTPHLIAPLLNYDHPGAVLVITWRSAGQ
jgi:hypothetical protein